MSQHVFHTSFEGQSVSVLMGWDRPLQGFFMVIQRLDVAKTTGDAGTDPRSTSGLADGGSEEDDEDEDDGFVYSNLSDLALARSCGLSASLDYFTDKLTQFGMTVPDALLKGVAEDCDRNVGNRYVEYDVEGRVKTDS